MLPNRAQVYMDLGDMVEKWKLTEASSNSCYIFLLYNSENPRILTIQLCSSHENIDSVNTYTFFSLLFTFYVFVL